jgi:anti-anti-sigma factor
MGMAPGSDERGRIAVRSVGNTLVLDLIGEFDLLNAEDLQLVLEFAAERYDRVVVDVTQTTFMDSAGVYALMHGRWSGLQVTIRGGGPALGIIKLMALESAFEMED